MRNKHKGNLLMLAGLLLIAAALFIAYTNVREEKMAEHSSEDVLMQLEAAEVTDAAAEEEATEVAVTDAEGWMIDWPMDSAGAPMAWPMGDDGMPVGSVTDEAGNEYTWPVDDEGAPVWSESWQPVNNALLPWVRDERGNVIAWPVDENGVPLAIGAVKDGWNELAGTLAAEETASPTYLLNPDMEMPVKKVNGNYYIGVLEIPKYELELPIMSDWSYPKLRVAPCRYYGSAYTGDMVICGHNYARYFGNLQNLKTGDEVRFTDMDGNVFVYQVCDRETLGRRDVAEMKSGDWDLTMFTCTYGGSNRIAVRCELVDIYTEE